LTVIKDATISTPPSTGFNYSPIFTVDDPEKNPENRYRYITALRTKYVATFTIAIQAHNACYS